MKLAVVIGHSDKAKGASMIRPFSFVQEYEYNTTVELHFNSFFSEHPKGHSVLYSAYNSAAKELAESINEWISTVIITRDKGATAVTEGGRGFNNLSQLSSPCVIVEPFFGSNMDDAMEGLQNIHPLGDAIIDGVAHFVSRQQGIHPVGVQ